MTGLRSRAARVSWLFLAVLIVLIPLRLWRAGLGEALWIDEIHSLVLASRSVPDLLRLSAADAHPPAYFLALKAWLKLGRAFGLERGLLWARLLNVVAWLFFSLAFWWLTRRKFGPRAGTLMASAVSAGGAVATMSQDVRNYSFAWGGLSLAFVALASIEFDGKPSRHLWSVFVLSAAFALWSHLLSGIVLACLLVVWLGWAIWAGHGRRASARGGAAAFAVMMLFLPWLLQVPTQIGGLTKSAPAWMTPATAKNLWIALTYWLPVGRVGNPEAFPFSLLWIVGIASWLLPLGAAAVASARRRSASPAPASVTSATTGPARVAVLGIVTTVLAVLALWCLARWGVAPVFHGPRYPLLAAGPMAAGLAAAAAFARGRAGEASFGAWLLLAPWLGLGLVGSVWGGLLEGRGGLPTAIRNAGIEAAYVMPSELIPFSGLRNQAIELFPIEKLPCDLARGGEAVVLDLNSWHLLDQPRDLVARQAVVQGLLGVFEDASELIHSRSGASLYLLKNPNRDHAEVLCRQGLAHAASPVPATGCTALAVDQRPGDGWSFLELGPDLIPRRWATIARAKIQFSAKVPAGPAVLHVWGYRLPQPADQQRVTIEIPGAEPARFDRELGPGRFLLELEVSFPHPVSRPFVVIDYPTWSPREAYGGHDDRRLAYSLEGAWLNPGVR